MSKVIHLSALVGAILIAAFVLLPWPSADAAAPAATDDPLTIGYVLRPVPTELARRGLQKEDSDKALELKTWTYTGDPYSSR